MKRSKVVAGILVVMFMATVPFVSRASAKNADNLTIGVESRVRAENRNNGDLDDGSPDKNDFVLQRTRLTFGWEPNEDLGFQAELLDGRVWGEEGTQTNPSLGRSLDEEISGADRQGADLNQVYVDVRHVGGGDNLLRIGRQEIIVAGQRLIGVHGWSNHRRAFDGALFRYHPGGGWQTTTFAALLNETGIRSSDAALYGWTARGPDPWGGRLEPFLLLLDDNRNVYGAGESRGGVPVAVSTSSDSASLSVWTLGLKGNWSLTAALDLELQVLKQWGARGSFDLDAGAAHGRLEYDLPFGVLESAVAEYNYGSGDEDPTDDEIGTLNDLNPRHTNHPNHDKYGSFDLGSWRNQQNAMVGISLNPVLDWGLGIHYWTFELAENADYWYAANGSTYLDPQGISRSVEAGREIDLELSIPWREHLDLSAGYARFMPDELPEDAGRRDDGDWGYLQVVASF